MDTKRESLTGTLGVWTDRLLLPRIRAYASLILLRGAALQPGQTLVVTAPVEASRFARLLAEEAYAQGAGDVQLRLVDEQVQQNRLRNAGFDEVKRHLQQEQDYLRVYREAGACFVRLIAAEEEVAEALPAERLALLSLAYAEIDSNGLASKLTFDVRRQGSAVPTYSWARKVFPHLNPDDRYRTLWETILHLAYLDEEDPVAGWDRHTALIARRKLHLEQAELVSLHFLSGTGTDLMVELAEDCTWVGGTVSDRQGISFSPSLPTEEVFTAPHRAKVNGTVKSSIPLYYQGSRIDGFTLTFRNGEVVDAKAESGLAELEALLATDEGARRLGEVALVPQDSRVACTNLLFHETLCDENRSCHLALGATYPGSIGGRDRSIEALSAKGFNSSSVHVDFMFGTDDLLVIGKSRHGENKVIMRNGRFGSELAGNP